MLLVPSSTDRLRPSCCADCADVPCPSPHRLEAPVVHGRAFYLSRCARLLRLLYQSVGIYSQRFEKLSTAESGTCTNMPLRRDVVVVLNHLRDALAAAEAFGTCA